MFNRTPPPQKSLPADCGLYLASPGGEDRREWGRSVQFVLRGAPTLRFQKPPQDFGGWLEGTFFRILAPALLDCLSLVKAGQMRELEEWERSRGMKNLHPAWISAGQEWLDELTFPPAASLTERYQGAYEEGRTNGNMVSILACQAADFSIPPFSLLLAVVYWWWHGSLRAPCNSLQTPSEIIATETANLTLLLNSVPHLTSRIRHLLTHHGQSDLQHPKTN